MRSDVERQHQRRYPFRPDPSGTHADDRSRRRRRNQRYRDRCTAGGSAAACEEKITEGSEVSLSAIADGGNHLVGWTTEVGTEAGTCTGAATSCKTAGLTEAVKLKATFAANSGPTKNVVIGTATAGEYPAGGITVEVEGEPSTKRAVCDGAPGAPGASGAPGAPGERGEIGFPGPLGPQGSAGPTGSAGAQGLPGAQGVQGAQGTPGAQGAQGSQGKQGPAGKVSVSCKVTNSKKVTCKVTTAKASASSLQVDTPPSRPRRQPRQHERKAPRAGAGSPAPRPLSAAFQWPEDGDSRPVEWNDRVTTPTRIRESRDVADETGRPDAL